MFDMRFRLTDVMEAKGIPSAYALAKKSGGVIPITTATRLVKRTVKRIDFVTLDALCRALDVSPNELLAPDDGSQWPTPSDQPGRRKRPPSPTPRR